MDIHGIIDKSPMDQVVSESIKHLDMTTLDKSPRRGYLS